MREFVSIREGGPPAEPLRDRLPRARIPPTFRPAATATDNPRLIATAAPAAAFGACFAPGR